MPRRLLDAVDDDVADGLGVFGRLDGRGTSGVNLPRFSRSSRSLSAASACACLCRGVFGPLDLGGGAAGASASISSSASSSSAVLGGMAAVGCWAWRWKWKRRWVGNGQKRFRQLVNGGARLWHK